MNKLVSLVLFLYTSIIYAAFNGDYTFQIESATQVEINAISNPQNGMMVYNTDSNQVNYYNGSSWITISSSNIYDSDGQLSANRIVDLNTYNLGYMNGNVGIGDATPDATLDVAGSFRLDGIFYDKDGDAGTVGQILASSDTGTDWIDTTSIPYISSNVFSMLPSSTQTFTITGYNFLSISTVTILGFDGTIDSVSVLSPTEIQITVTSGSASADYDIVITNNAVSNTSWAGNGDNLLHVASEITYLYAITSSTQCAEQLPYGSNHIVESDSPYFSTEYKNISHNKMRQIFTIGGTEIYRITYNFTTTKTLQERFDSATTSGEDVNWVVEYSGNTYNYGPHKWWYSDGAFVTGKWNSSGTNWSNDDGVWGAAPNDIDGNGGPYQTWGHGNRNSSDTATCDDYYTNGTAASSGNIKNYMYLVIP